MALTMPGTLGGGAAAGGGFGSFLGGPWGIALSMLGAPLLGQLFGRGDPAGKRYREIKNLLNPESIRAQGITDFNTTLGSPGWAEARRQVIGAGGGLESRLKADAARAGLNTSGIGLAAPALAHSTIGTNMGRMTAQAWQDAMSSSREGAFRRAGILGGMPMQQNYPAQFTGAGLNALVAYLLKRYGG